MIDEMTPGAAQTPQTARLLHRSLLGGLLMIAAVFLFLGFGLHTVPLLVPGRETLIIGYVLAACGVAPLVFVVFAANSRVPARTSGQGDAAFWLRAFGPVLSIWAIVEGAGIIGAVGALLTGLLAPAVVCVIALVCLAMLSPGHFENA
jgi:hypothetical protein